jgi:hypothetical protein
MLRRRTFDIVRAPRFTRQESLFRQNAGTSRLKACAPQARSRDVS